MCRGIGVGRRGFVGTNRRHQDDLLGDGVEDGHDRRPRQYTVGQVKRVGIDVGQPLHQPDHVVADGTKDTCGHGRKARRQLDPGGGQQVAQGIQRAARLRRELLGADVCAPGDLGLIAPAAPDQIRVQRDDRIARPKRAALHRFKQEGIGLAMADLQEGGDWRLQIVDQPGPDDLWGAAVVGRLKGLVRRL